VRQLVYRDRRFVVTADYWEAPIWGWRPELRELDPPDDAENRPARERLLLEANQGFPTPYQCLATAVQSLIEALDRAALAESSAATEGEA
jgi:hypothetical protein